MSYDLKTIQEILESAEKIGVMKTAKLFGIARNTIYKWQRAQKVSAKARKSDSKQKRLLVIRRILIENAKQNFYIYNAVDLFTSLEINGFAYHNNYQTPVKFLEAVINLFFLKENIEDFQIQIYGFSRTRNFDKFYLLKSKAKFTITKTSKKYKYNSFKKTEISRISDKAESLKNLVKSQINYNIALDTNFKSNIKFCPPVNLDLYSKDSFDLNLQNKRIDSEYLSGILNSVKTFLQKNEIDTAELYLKNAEVYFKYFKDTKLKYFFVTLKQEYFTITGDNLKQLSFLITEFKKCPVKSHNLAFFLCLKISKLYFDTLEWKKFKYYLSKLAAFEKDTIPIDLVFEYELLKVRDKYKFTNDLSNINDIKKLIIKFRGEITGKNEASAWYQIIELYNRNINFKESEKILEKVKAISALQTDNHFHYDFLLRKAFIILKKNDFELFRTIITEIEEKLKKYKNLSLHYELEILKTYYYLETGDLAKVKKITDRIISYAELNNRKTLCFRAYIILQRYHSKKGEREKSSFYTRKQIKISKEMMNTYLEVQSINNHLANIISSEKQDEKKFYIEQLKIKSSKLKNPGFQNRLLIFNGIYELQNKNYKKSAALFDKAIKIARKPKNLAMLYYLFSYKAQVKRLQKKYRSAMYCINQSIFYYELCSLKSDYPRLLLIKAEIYIDTKNLKRAKHYLKIARESSQKLKNKSMEKHCTSLLEKIATM